MLMIRSRPFHNEELNVASCLAYGLGAYLLLIVLLGLGLAGCARVVDDPLADHSFLTKQPCAPPCWYGLELDKSGKEEVYKVIKGLSFIAQDSIREATSPWLKDDNAKYVSWNCLHPGREGCGAAKLSQDRLKLLWMVVGYPLTFAAVIAQLGPPDYVDYGVYHPEVGGCQIKLSWRDRGIVVESLDTRNSGQCDAIRQGKGIVADAQVTAIYYTVREGFGSEPGGCCLRIPWPGLAKP